MKPISTMRTFTVFLSGAIAISLMAFGSAEGGPAGGNHKNGKGIVMDPEANRSHGWLAHLDENKDERISLEEWLNGWRNLFTRADSNNDNALSNDEIEAFRKMMRAEMAKRADEARKKLFETHDANKDGKVSRDEFRGPDILWEKLDKNRDGVLTPDEWEPRRDTEQNISQMFNRLDGNGDGKISRDEWKGPPSIFARIDKNQDGYLTGDELKAARDRMVEGKERGLGAHFEKALEKFDANKDGLLQFSEAETAAREAFKKLDSNGDGYLDRADRSEMWQQKGKLDRGKRGRGHRGG